MATPRAGKLVRKAGRERLGICRTTDMGVIAGPPITVYLVDTELESHVRIQTQDRWSLQLAHGFGVSNPLPDRNRANLIGIAAPNLR